MHAVLLAKYSVIYEASESRLPAIDGVRQCEPPPGVTGFAGMNPDSFLTQASISLSKSNRRKSAKQSG